MITHVDWIIQNSGRRQLEDVSHPHEETALVLISSQKDWNLRNVSTLHDFQGFVDQKCAGNVFLDYDRGSGKDCSKIRDLVLQLGFDTVEKC